MCPVLRAGVCVCGDEDSNPGSSSDENLTNPKLTHVLRQTTEKHLCYFCWRLL